MLSFANLIAIVSMTIVLSYSCNRLAHAETRYSNLDELYSAAKILGKAKLTSNQNSDIDVLFGFARESKSDVGKRYFEGVQKAVTNFNIKAQNYINQSGKKTGWLTNLVQSIGGPLKELHAASRDYHYLREATQRYQERIKLGPLQLADVNCDLAKFQIETTGKILFVLQTDIKYLAIQVPALMNKAINKQLQGAGYEASHDLYNLKELKPAQRLLLKEFLLNRVNVDEMTIGDAVDRFDTASSLVLGRLLDSCSAHLVYMQTWTRLRSAVDPCKHSAVATEPMDSEGLLQPILLDDYENTASFCEPFLKNLTD